MVGGWKSGRIEKILFYLLFVWLRVENWRDGKKKCLYKFTHIPLLKNYDQLKQKSDKQPKKKKKNNHPKLFIKKSTTPTAPRNQKKIEGWGRRRGHVPRK